VPSTQTLKSFQSQFAIIANNSLLVVLLPIGKHYIITSSFSYIYAMVYQCVTYKLWSLGVAFAKYLFCVLSEFEEL